jgi:hypothetical protein
MIAVCSLTLPTSRFGAQVRTCKLIIKSNVTRRNDRPELSPSDYANASGLGDRRRRDHRASCRDGLHRIRPFNRSTLVIAANFAKLPELLRQ